MVGQLKEHEQGVGVKESEAMSLEPWVMFSLSADAIRPVVLTLNPFKVTSATECEEETMNSSSHRVQLVIVAASSDEGHKGCNIVDKPYTMHPSGRRSIVSKSHINRQELKLCDLSFMMGPHLKDFRRLIWTTQRR